MQPSGISVSIRESLVEGSSRTQTTLVVDPLITKDGTRIAMSDIGDIAFAKIDVGTSQEEIISFTGITDNTSTYTLTGVVWGYNFHNTTGSVNANKKRHTSGASFIIGTDFHFINEQYVDKDNAQTIAGAKTFTSNVTIPTVPVNADHAVSKQYADSISTTGINSMAVVDAGGITIDINSGYYILNGSTNQYAGATAQALTDDTINYVELVDGALSINTSAFSDDAIPLAKITCASGDITVLEDARSFYTGVDIVANQGIGRSSSGIFIDLATDAELEFSSGKLRLKDTITKATTFTELPTIPETPTADTHAASKGYVDGAIAAKVNTYLVASDTLVASADTERTEVGSTYALKKEIKVDAITGTDFTSTIRVKFGLKTNSAGNTAYGRIYVNGVAVGTERAKTGDTNYTTYSEDITVADGDLVQLYAKDDGSSMTTYVNNFRIYFDKVVQVIDDTTVNTD